MTSEDEYKKEIDKWINKKETKVARKFWIIVSALSDEWQIRDRDEFKIPYEKLKKIVELEDLEALLTTLHNRKFIFISKKVAQMPPSDDPMNKPGGMSLWQPINEDPQMIYSPDTQIEIFSNRFLYLRKRLEELFNYKKQSEMVQKIVAPLISSPMLTQAIKDAQKGVEMMKRYNETEETILNAGSVLIKHDMDQKVEEATLRRLMLEKLEQEQVQSGVLKSYKLIFHPDDGIAEYRSSEYQFKGKARAFLTYLHNSKNTPFSLDDIKTKCNPLIANERHHFKGDKDTRDIVSYIREMLKVNKGEFFPIGKRNNNWIWVEK